MVIVILLMANQIGSDGEGNRKEIEGTRERIQIWILCIISIGYYDGIISG